MTGWWDDLPDEYGDQDPKGAPPGYVVLFFLLVCIGVPLIVMWATA